LRADLAAAGAELFDDEDDDDQPILAPLNQPGATAPQGEGGRRRRRRRRRGRGGNALAGGEPNVSFGAPGNDRSSQPRIEGAIQPTPIVSIDSEPSAEPRDPSAVPRPVVRDRHQIMAGGQPTGIDVPLSDGDELAGRDLADAIFTVLSSFDRN